MKIVQAILSHPIGSRVRWIGRKLYSYRVILEFPPSIRMLKRCGQIVPHRLPYVVMVIPVDIDSGRYFHYNGLWLTFRTSRLTGKDDEVLCHPRLENVYFNGRICLGLLEKGLILQSAQNIGHMISDIADYVWSSEFKPSIVDDDVLPFSSWPEDVLREGLWPIALRMGDVMEDDFQTLYSAFEI